MTYKVEISHLATIDLEKIISYYHELNKSTARKYYKNIIIRMKDLKNFPEMGRIVPEFADIFSDKYRELIYENFRIIYRIENNVIKILRIIDARMLLKIDYVDDI